MHVMRDSSTRMIKGMPCQRTDAQQNKGRSANEGREGAATGVVAEARGATKGQEHARNAHEGAKRGTKKQRGVTINGKGCKREVPPTAAQF